MSQVVTFLLSAGFVINGLVGFAFTGFADFTNHTGHDVFGFNVNPLHNLVHLAIGLIGLVCCWRIAATRFFGWLLVFGYGSVMAYGIFVVVKPGMNFLALNSADNVLHGLAAFVGLMIALWGSWQPEEAQAPARHRSV